MRLLPQPQSFEDVGRDEVEPLLFLQHHRLCIDGRSILIPKLRCGVEHIHAVRLRHQVEIFFHLLSAIVRKTTTTRHTTQPKSAYSWEAEMYRVCMLFPASRVFTTEEVTKLEAWIRDCPIKARSA